MAKKIIMLIIMIHVFISVDVDNYHDKCLFFFFFGNMAKIILVNYYEHSYQSISIIITINVRFLLHLF